MIHDGADALAAHLHNAAGFLLGGDHGFAVLDALHHGLFAVDVFAGVHGVDRNLRMPVVGRGDDDCVDVFARQHFAIIASREQRIAVNLLGAIQPALVNVGDRDQLDARLGERGLRVAGPHAA